MSPNPQGIISASVNGLNTLAGGTRTELKVVRPWQPKLIFPEKKDCPFCSRAQTNEHPIAAGWKTFQNAFTPFPYHRLLIPTECWSEAELRSLKGADVIATVLRLALSEIKRTRTLSYPMWIYTHVGYGAGQNLTHNHWHLCEAPTRPEGFMPGDHVPLWTSANFETYLAGVRAGQCVISFSSDLRKETDILCMEDPASVLPESELLDEFAGESARLIDQFNVKFNDPDYCLMFAFNGDDEWHARYTPILNNWGGSEFAALDYGTPFVLPWPHEATRDLLLSK